MSAGDGALYGSVPRSGESAHWIHCGASMLEANDEENAANHFHVFVRKLGGRVEDVHARMSVMTHEPTLKSWLQRPDRPLDAVFLEYRHQMEFAGRPLTAVMRVPEEVDAGHGEMPAAAVEQPTIGGTRQPTPSRSADTDPSPSDSGTDASAGATASSGVRTRSAAAAAAAAGGAEEEEEEDEEEEEEEDEEEEEV